MKYSQATTLAKGDTYKQLTRADILKAIESVGPRPEDPLNGATVLWCHPSDTESVEAANKLAAAATDRRITVTQSPNAYPCRIYGFNGASFLPCLVIRTKEEDSEDRIH